MEGNGGIYDELSADCEADPGHAAWRSAQSALEEFPVSTPFVDAVTGNPASFDTSVQAAWDEEYLYIRFLCEDKDIVATMVNRDDPLYEEEVVEVFIAPENLNQYYEFNLSPRNVVFDSFITHDGKKHQGDPSWDCPGLIHRVIRKENNGGGEFGSWEGLLAIPFSCLGVEPNGIWFCE